MVIIFYILKNCCPSVSIADVQRLAKRSESQTSKRYVGFKQLTTDNGVDGPTEMSSPPSGGPTFSEAPSVAPVVPEVLPRKPPSLDPLPLPPRATSYPANLFSPPRSKEEMQKIITAALDPSPTEEAMKNAQQAINIQGLPHPQNISLAT